MTTLTLTATTMRRGVWEGVITQTGQGVPQIAVTHLDKPVPDIDLQENGETWVLRVTIPADAIADGVQTFLITDTSDGSRIGDFTLIAGEALGDDMRAEMELLRAELDMLKRAFRRHCIETS
ncbi:hypothetical protein [Ascidiaceihabitans sp.]|uniref:hypothetical protein n=1 Tax=Ascidiaceihabitans sp. TaxID=1872644 RepID=UPI00329A6291